jgi:flagellar biosynthesis protein FlhF
VEYQTFRGSDVHEALFAVRRALGADALIESTREVKSGRGGIFGSSFVEVVAAPSLVKGSTEPSRSPSRAARAPQQKSASKSALEREVQALRSMVSELSERRSPRDRLNAMLSSAGLEGDVAKKLAHGVSKGSKGDPLQMRDVLRRRVAERILTRPDLIERRIPQLITCVGPSGVGKTTTLAKLAARAKLDLGVDVSVITLDTFRVGAVEQWQRYADLLQIPMAVAEEPATFERLVQNAGSDLILVDTAGRHLRDEGAVLRLAECLDSVQGYHKEVQLVLPASIRGPEAERLVASYKRPALTGLVITKLDEADQLGGCLHPALTLRLPVTYLCDGARVPEDIHTAASDTLLDALFPGNS